MADSPAPGFGDLLALFGTNPFSGLTKSFQQFQRGVEQLLTTIDNLNETMKQLNEVPARVTRMLDLVDEPLRAFVPQVTRTLKAADDMVERMNAPIERVAPGLNRLADTLSSPTITDMPRDLNEFLSTLTDLGKRLQPLGQIAETAGGMFRNNPFASFMTGGTQRPAESPAAPAPTPPHADETPPPPPAKKAAAKKTTTTHKRAAAKKPAAKKTAARKQSARRSSSRHHHSGTAAVRRRPRPAQCLATNGVAHHSARERWRRGRRW